MGRLKEYKGKKILEASERINNVYSYLNREQQEMNDEMCEVRTIIINLLHDLDEAKEKGIIE